MTADDLRWSHAGVTLEVAWSTEQAPHLTAFAAGGVTVTMPPGRPLTDVLTVAEGRVLAGDRLTRTAFGDRARHVGHESVDVAGGRALEITVRDPGTGLTARRRLEVLDGTAVVRSVVTVTNAGTSPAVLRSVPSWVSRLGGPGAEPPGVRAWTLHRGRSDWIGEGRWSAGRNDALLFPDLNGPGKRAEPRGAYAVVSTGTWSTGKDLPAAVLSADGAAWAWQIEHQGGWRWEVGDDLVDGYVALSGPTDIDHQWLAVLAPGESFTTVPVAVTLGRDLEATVAQLTAYRRRARREHVDNHAPRVVFNDYMNTLDGDPTTDRLLPLVDAAASVGAEVFCVDAGWYDDSGHWWDSVGAWQPSLRRFPGGLREVTDRIHRAGMVPGLWLEPEVVGVRSPVAEILPPEAFFQRAGQRVAEHGRYHLDLRHPAARAHLDGVVDRLVDDFGLGFFKLDYNVDPGAGTDVAADAPGAGLLGHHRAHLDWLDGVLDRHPGLIVENCGSGAMRADFAILSRLQLQSTSDQEDPLRYAPIAAAAPMTILPEQAANWAYPQPGMTSEQLAFTLATGLSGRLYLSGHLDRMSAAELALVWEAVALARRLRRTLPRSRPTWPLGLPGWPSEWVALGLSSDTVHHVTVWNRDPDQATATLDLAGALDGRARDDLTVEQVFPADLPLWPTSWEPGTHRLRILNPTGEAGARILRIAPLGWSA